jgi:hypothetical protein
VQKEGKGEEGAARSEQGVSRRKEGDEGGENENAPLFKGSSAFGSKNKYCNPTMTAFKLRTGFQSSRRMLRQTFPSRSRLGW